MQDDCTYGFNVTLGIVQKNFFKCTDIEKGQQRWQLELAEALLLEDYEAFPAMKNIKRLIIHRDVRQSLGEMSDYP